jgi:formate dehydrogenase major subunit
VQIQESKAGSCDIVPGRRPSGDALLRLVADYQSRAGSTVMTGNELRTGHPESRPKPTPESSPELNPQASPNTRED